jgi:hypothetical protein
MRFLAILPVIISLTVNAAIEDLAVGVGQVELESLTSTITGDAPESYQVSFPIGAFSTAPAVFILPDNVNPEPMTLRVHTVTASGFEVFVSESDGEDNTAYPATNFDYIAIEPGNYTIGGANIQVDATTITSVSSKADGTNHQNVSYLSAYSGSPPVVLTQLQSLNSDTSLLNTAGEFSRTTQPFLEISQGDPGLTTFPVSLERAETTAGTVSGSGETVAWLAITDQSDISENDNDGNSVDIKAFYVPDNITGNCTSNTLVAGSVTNFSSGTPIYFGSQVGRDGGDGGWLRRCSSGTSFIEVQVEEDDVDGEQNHTGEEANFLAVSNAFQMSTSDPDSPNINMLVASDTIPIEVGGGLTVTYSLSPTTVDFTTVFGIDFTAAPVVVPMSTDDGNGEPAYVRVWGVTSTGFTMAQTVPEGVTIPADKMTVDFLAVVPGIHTLPDGREIAAGRQSISGCVGSNTTCSGTYTAMNFGTTFTNPAAVLAAPQTINNDGVFDPIDAADPFISTSIINVNATQFDGAFEFAQTNQGSPLGGVESFGWIAMDSGISSNLHAAQGTTNGDHLVEIRTEVTTNNIGGWDDGCSSNNFTSAFTLSSSPLTIATHNTRNGADGGWLRRCSNSASSFGLQMDEDTAVDTERSHGSREEAGVIAFSNTFGWTPATYSNMKLGATFSDPVNGTDNPKAIPQAEIDYTVFITATSRIGIDDDTVSVTDAVPVNTELFVGDLVGGCPIDIVVNTAGVSFACATDLLLLGGSPVGCAADVDGYCPFSTYDFSGADWSADVTSIKVNPKGEFSGSTGVGVEPEFRFRFRVRLN